MHIYILQMHITLPSSFYETIMAYSLNKEDDIFYISINRGQFYKLINSIHLMAQLLKKQLEI